MPVRSRFSQTTIGFLTVLILFLSISDSIAEKTYNFAVLPRFFPIVILERFGPLADYLADEAGIDVEFVMPRNFSDYIDMARKGKILFSYQNPVVFAKISEYVKPLAIASKGAHKTRFRGIIIVRTDSGINTIADLKGKLVSIVSLQSVGGYISQKDFLAQNGISVKTDIVVREATDNKQENVILDVYSKKTTAGFIRESALHRMDKVIEPAKIKVLAETSWLPNWVFSAHKSVEADVTDTIQSALLNLPANSRVLKAAGLEGFVAPDPRAIKNVRKMVLSK
jgi:phosphonate transport system substrate-binding protein